MAKYIFTKTTRVPSEICPGLVYVVRKNTEKRRPSLMANLIEPMRKRNEISQQIEKNNQSIGPEFRNSNGDLTKEGLVKASVLNAELHNQWNDNLRLEHWPVYVNWGLAKIESADGEDGAFKVELENGEILDMSVENFSEWPSELANEIADIISVGTALTAYETKN